MAMMNFIRRLHSLDDCILCEAGDQRSCVASWRMRRNVAHAAKPGFLEIGWNPDQAVPTFSRRIGWLPRSNGLACRGGYHRRCRSSGGGERLSLVDPLPGQVEIETAEMTI